MRNQFTKRLVALETRMNPHRRCTACGDHPMRVMYIDPEMETVWQESIPETGCPACGTPIFQDLIIWVSQEEDSAL